MKSPFPGQPPNAPLVSKPTLPPSSTSVLGPPPPTGWGTSDGQPSYQHSNPGPTDNERPRGYRGSTTGGQNR